MDLQIEALQDPLVWLGWIAEPYILELDVTFESLWVDLNVLSLWLVYSIDSGFGVDVREDA